MISIRTLRIIRWSTLALIVLLASGIAVIQFGPKGSSQRQPVPPTLLPAPSLSPRAFPSAARSRLLTIKAMPSPMLTIAVGGSWFSSATPTALMNARCGHSPSLTCRPTTTPPFSRDRLATVSIKPHMDNLSIEASAETHSIRTTKIPFLWSSMIGC
jgi:hypothetical protein